MRLCKPHRTIGVRALANSLSTSRACHFDRSGPTNSPCINRVCHRSTLHPPTGPVISTGVGRRFFPPSLPRRCRPTQWRNLSSIDGGGLCSPSATITTQLLKRRKFALYSALNLPIFSTFQTLASFALFPPNPLSCCRQLTDSFCALFVTFCNAKPLFSTSCGLFWQKHRG
jgi:hypothetical protein